MPFRKNRKIEKPPDDAYGRATNAERFRPLHPAALKMLDDLEARFEVQRAEGHGLDGDMETRARHPAVRPAVALKPMDPEAASIAVMFTSFPGLAVRFGRWFEDWFPGCGCDACHESAEGEMERLEERVEALTSGGFREAAIYSPRSLLSIIGDKLRIAYTPFRASGKLAKGYAPCRRKFGGGSHTIAQFRGPSVRMSSRGSLSDARVFEITEGQPSLEIDWKPWPLRKMRPSINP